MFGRVIGGVLLTLVLGAGALVLGFQGYQAYLRWLVAGAGREPAAGGRDNG